ncbi:alcohol dehydrogenase catalytic domain-containing protein [Paraburkholderia sp. HD33-4]|uniref:alcohol dehydrogenase catalytic domain-containing protein n=1 Tax=Paraburkholderia sp. HD33-4 TaxID=2883242 RepID=UPI001F2D75BF|nr:alcohol dehydrogenase catalytic domain-containing protein [Paraburkholderia sp. HD33-4]
MEVVVQVAAATVNPTDLLMLAGRQAALMEGLTPPYVSGMEFSGLIHELGEGVADLNVGQAVMGIINPRQPGGGAQAEFVRVPAASVASVPQTLELGAAATLPMNGLTAKMCLDALGLDPGSVLLVTGAAGAVGGYVVQLARRAGLRVVADAKSADWDLVVGLGANDVVSRGPGLFDSVRAMHPQGVDGLVDSALLGDPAAALVRDGGATALLRSSQVAMDIRLRHTHIGVLQQLTNTEALRWLVDRVQEGTLTPRVAARLPMERAQAGYTLVQQGGLRGRVILEFGAATRG